MASADGLVGFSSKGPGVDLAVIKPDLVAVGTNFYTAAQAFDDMDELRDARVAGELKLVVRKLIEAAKLLVGR